ncbi:transglutaminase TgpA family protein [Frateuria aurantia]
MRRSSLLPPPPPALPLTQRAQQWAWISVALAVALQSPHQPVWYSLGLLLAGLRPALACRHGISKPLARRWLLAGLVMLLLAIGAAYRGEWLARETGIALATGLLVLKAMESAQRRDLQIVAGFACFVTMSALLTDQGMSNTLLAGLCLIAPLCCLQALQADAAPAAALWRDAIPMTVLLLLAIPVTAIAFLLAPRLSSPLWGASGPPLAETGLGPQLSPGDFSQILNNDAPALRISFSSTPPPETQRYFRAYVLWHFDGTDWNAAPPIATSDHAAMTADAPVTHYQVIMEASGQRHLPVLDWPVGPAKVAGAHLDADGILLRTAAVDSTIGYSMTSTGHPPISRGELDPVSRQAGLQWPAGAAPQTLAQGRRWRAQGLDDEAIVAHALQMFRRQGFSYTLSPPPVSGDATDGFLFGTRRGYCVHYASAFVLLMRAAGLPARVVSGYQGGYWSAAGRYLLVRQSDAHAWAEVWIARRHAWIRYDPTAMASPERITEGALAANGPTGEWSRRSWLASLRNHWDLVNQVWDRSVINFSQARQNRLFAAQPNLSLWSGIDKRWALLLVLFCLAGMALIWVQRAPRPADPMAQAWQQLTAYCGRHGVPIRIAEGPCAYLDRVIQRFPLHRKEIERLRTLYVIPRYAESRLRPDQIRAFRRAVGNFRRGKLS